MSTFRVPFSQIDATYLDSLVTNGVAEGRQLDYKERLPGDDDKSKLEFLANVSSFANSVGGDLVYGIREARDSTNTPLAIPKGVVGLPEVNLDQAQLRLDDLLRHSVDPRIPGVAFHRVPRGTDSPCLLIRVPQSPLRLHMVTFRGASRFYGRGASGRFQLDVGQIRAGFLEGETAHERVRRFRLDRVARVVVGETPIQMGEGTKLIFHALPLTSLDVWPAFLKIAENAVQIMNLLGPLGGTAEDWRYNLDGFVAYPVRSDPSSQTYIQLFRDGGTEAAGAILHFDPSLRGFYGLAIEVGAIQVLKRTQSLWKRLGVTGPIVLGLALSGVKGRKMLGPSQLWAEPRETFDADLAIIPEIVVEDENAPPGQALRPLFDLTWNAGGWPRSPSYTPTGERKEPT